jgi:hypothetical protein
VDVMAFKKAEESNYYIVRVNELNGKDAKGIKISFPGKIIDAYEVNGQEKKTGTVDFSGGVLNFDMTRFLIRSFAVKFEDPALKSPKTEQVTVDLPFNLDAVSFDSNRSDGNMDDGLTLPAELLPDKIVSEDIYFTTGPKADGQNNAVICDGQRIKLPGGKYNRLYILANATEDTQASFKTGRKTYNMGIQGWTGFVGQHYDRHLYFNNLKVASISKAFTKRDDIAWFASHRHTPEANDTYVYSYLYKYVINIPEGTTSLILPRNSKVRIFAVTVALEPDDDIVPLQPLYDDFKNDKPLRLRTTEYVKPDMQPLVYTQKPLFVAVPGQRQMPRFIGYLKSIGADTVVSATPPSVSDYADKASGNGVTVIYSATGESVNGTNYNNTRIDISNILNSADGKLKDTLLFDNGEGRILIDLKKKINIDRINMYFDQFRNRGSQIFTIWASDEDGGLSGDPGKMGWTYAGVYGLSRNIGNGISYQYNNNLKCRYLLFVSDGNWHGTEYFKQLDIFEKQE